jgi:LacI family gluconate utilization system Gnt-I transcriptional repressor
MTESKKGKRRTKTAASPSIGAKPPAKAVRSHTPTIRDVSRLASVSRMTVSRVLSNSNLVSPDTAERVNRAIADLGYVPDRAASSMASRRTGFVGYMMPNLTSANFSSVAHGLADVLQDANYQLLISYTDYDLAQEEVEIRNLLARRPEAIVLTSGVHTREASAMLLHANVPVVEVADLQPRSVYHSVGFSNYQVGRMAAQYLLQRGLRRIGAIGCESAGDNGDYRGEERIQGFEDELRTAGIPADLVIRKDRPPVSYAHGREAISTLLERDPRIEGIFAVSDVTAFGAVMECRRRQIAVPEQISVIGFGDFDFASEMEPRLTTIHVDFRELGRRTGRLIVDSLAGRCGKERVVIDVGLSLLERESVASRSLP